MKGFTSYSDGIVSAPSVGARVGSAPAPSKEERVESDLVKEQVEAELLRKGSPLARQIGSCNDLEQELNNERARNGLGPLKCDHNMRWVANQHVENQLDNGYTFGEVQML